jgi:hypothetical protein
MVIPTFFCTWPDGAARRSALLCLRLLVLCKQETALILRVLLCAHGLTRAYCREYGSCAIHDAAAKGKASVIESLVGQGADVNAFDE